MFFKWITAHEYVIVCSLSITRDNIYIHTYNTTLHVPLSPEVTPHDWPRKRSKGVRRTPCCPSSMAVLVGICGVGADYQNRPERTLGTTTKKTRRRFLFLSHIKGSSTCRQQGATANASVTRPQCLCAG